MRKLWVLLTVATVAISLGCGGDKKDDDNGGSAAAGSVEAAVKEMMDAFKKGDPGPFLAHMDLDGMYEVMVPEEQRAEMSLEDFKTQMHEGMTQAGPPPEGFAYEIVGTKKQGDTVLVTVKVKEAEDAEWDQSEVEFKKMDGVWKITAEGFRKLMES